MEKDVASEPMTFSNPVSAVAPYLRRMIAVSRLMVLWALFTAGLASAHEVRPAIGDFEISQDQVTVEISVMVEALLAEIDLSSVANTDEAENAGDYTSLRALSPDALRDVFDEKWPAISAGIVIKAGDRAITPELVGIDIPEIGDVALPRDSVLSLRADLPTDGSALQMGWAPEYGPLVLRQAGSIETAYTGYLDSGDLTPPLPREGVLEQSTATVIKDYVVLGFEHILPKGLDHILFVLGLFFFSLALRPLLLQITMFTLAHTVTLALGSLGVVAINPAVVEPLIAASIAFIAIENILTTKMHAWRPFVIFGFGLLHGLGFASMLNDIGLSQSHFITSLISFNVGVELGQLTVIALAFLLLALPFGRKPWWRSRIQIPASVLISLVAIWWVFERTLLA